MDAKATNKSINRILDTLIMNRGDTWIIEIRWLLWVRIANNSTNNNNIFTNVIVIYV